MTDYPISTDTEGGSALEQAKARLVPNWEWLALLAETTNDVIFSFSLWPEIRCDYISPSVERMVGYTPQEHYLNPRLSLSYVHPNDRSRLEGLFESFQDHTERMPIRWIHKDGSVVWTEATISVVKDRAGRFTTICGINRDISQHHARDLEVESQRCSLAAVVENSPIGIFVVDSHGEVLVINREASRILGSFAGAKRTPEWYADVELRRADDGSVYRIEETPLQRALLLGQRVVAEEIHIDRPDGVSTRVLINSGPVTSTDGEQIGAVATIQDMSQWEVDAGLRAEAISALGRRLKEPVLGIKGLLALTATTGYSLDNSWFEIFGLMEREVASLDHLVSNISNWASFRFGKMAINPRTAGTDEVLDPCLAEFDRRGHSQRLSVDKDSYLPPFAMDVAKVQQAVNALLEYVVRHSSAESGMQLSATEHEDSVSFIIRGDLGMVVSETSQDSSVLPEGDAHHRSGDFLELSLARAVAEGHGGQFWLKAASADVPITVGLTISTVSPKNAELDQDDSAFGPRPLEGKRAVVASNDIPLLRLVRRAVSEAGGVVEIHSTVNDVLECLELGETDVAFISIELVGHSSGAAAFVDALEDSTVRTPLIWLVEEPGGYYASMAVAAAMYTDFMVSPPSTMEVVSRAYRALGRRDSCFPPSNGRVFYHDGLSVDLSRHQVTLEGCEISLSPMEFRLLEQLTLNAGRAMTHRQLLQRVWGTTYSDEVQLLHSMVRNLRRRLGDSADDPRWIVSVPYLGYKLGRS